MSLLCLPACTGKRALNRLSVPELHEHITGIFCAKGFKYNQPILYRARTLDSNRLRQAENKSCIICEKKTRPEKVSQLAR